MTNKVLIVGAGPVAIEYFKICKDLGWESTVVGRGETNAKTFAAATGHNPLLGGLAKNLDAMKGCSHAIVAVSEDQLHVSALNLLQAEVKNILLEKPGAATFGSLIELNKECEKKNAKISIAYNRRYFASVNELRKRIVDDGGCQSFYFEFTEWGHVIAGLQKNPGVKENWFWHNSSHVVDLAFFIAGHPIQLASISAGRLDWHPAGSIFVGHGKTDKNSYFSYHSNWEGPGRWGLEFITPKNRYFLRPMEKLMVQPKGTIAISEIAIDANLDTKYKPGFFLQTQDFLNGKPGNLQTIEKQVKMVSTYQQILNGRPN